MTISRSSTVHKSVDMWISKYRFFLILIIPLFFNPFSAFADQVLTPDNSCASTWAGSSCGTPFATTTISTLTEWTPVGGASFCVYNPSFDALNLSYLYTISTQSAPTGLPRNIGAYAQITTDTGTAVSSFTVAGTTFYLNKYDITGANPNHGVCVDHTTGGNQPTLSYIVSNDNLSFTTQAQYESYVATHITDLNGATRIVNFTPNDGDIVSSSTPVNFTLLAYINSDDIRTLLGVHTVTVNIYLHNIDQNVVFNQFSPNDIVLYNGEATTSGAFYFATSTTLSAGNYRLEATLTKVYLGAFTNPFSNVNNTISHQFIVGNETFLGHISQASFTETNAIFSSFTATSTSALAGKCNVLSGFDVTQCLAFLFIPSSAQMNDAMNSLKGGLLTHAPWGYATRLYTIMTGTATSSIPDLDAKVPISVTDYVTFHMGLSDAVNSATALNNSLVDPISGKGVRDVAEPIVDLIVGFALIYEIYADLTKSHAHKNQPKK